MNSVSRGRGRPKGSETNDPPTLETVADLILANPKMRPTTAMRRVERTATDSDLRRLQIKWKQRGSALMEAARQKLNASANQVPVSTGTALSYPAVGYSVFGPSAINTATGHLERETLRAAMLGFTDASTLNAIAAAERATTMATDLEKIAAVKAAADYVESAGYRAVVAFHESAAMKAIHNYVNSPTMRAIEKQQEMLDRLRRLGF